MVSKYLANAEIPCSNSSNSNNSAHIKKCTLIDHPTQKFVFLDETEFYLPLFGRFNT